MRKVLALIPIALGIIPTNSQAGTCEEAVLSFAERHRLSVEVPAASLKGNKIIIPNTSDTDGVIRPPNLGTDTVITPPKIGDNMPTTPKIAPDRMTTRKPTPGQRARAEALLLAARAASRSGDEKACYAKLKQAQQILTPPQSGQQG